MQHNHLIESITDAQAHMRDQFRNGATGVLVSGIIWLTTAGVIDLFSNKQAIWTLLVGGALIYPISTLIDRLVGSQVVTHKANPLTGLAMEGTFFMLMTIPIAYGLSLQRPEWFFQGMALIIGGRYLTFRTLYGNKLYWVLGGLLGLSAYGLFITHMPSLVTTLTVGLIEVLFSVVLFYDYSSKQKAESVRLYS